MTAYQLLPGLTPDEYEALKADIAVNGVRVPVDVDEDGEILDGHHRAHACVELGIDLPRRVVAGLSESGKRSHALAVNVHRRSLTREQKRDLIAASLMADPDLSDRQHADRTGSSHPTVGDVRDELEQSDQLESFTSRTSADGRRRPAASKRPEPDPDQLERERRERATRSVAGAVVSLWSRLDPDPKVLFDDWLPDANPHADQRGIPDLFDADGLRRVASLVDRLADLVETKEGGHL